MTSTWLKQMNEALYTVEQFLMEKKSGQASPEVEQILKFTSVVLKTDVAGPLEYALRKILSDPITITLMRKGLILEDAKKNMKFGPFFKSDDPAIPTRNVILVLECEERGETLILTLCIQNVFKCITTHGKAINDLGKATQVSLYVAQMLAQSICSFVTEIGSGFIERSIRNEITGRTIVKSVQSPYSTTQRNSAVKGILRDAMKQDIAISFMHEKLGVSGTRMVEDAINNFDSSKIGDLQQGMSRALATQTVAPIIESVTGMITSTVGNVHAHDDIDACDQD